MRKLESKHLRIRYGANSRNRKYDYLTFAHGYCSACGKPGILQEGLDIPLAKTLNCRACGELMNESTLWDKVPVYVLWVTGEHRVSQ